jgi:hypothetical protein
MCYKSLFIQSTSYVINAMKYSCAFNNCDLLRLMLAIKGYANFHSEIIKACHVQSIFVSTFRWLY